MPVDGIDGDPAKLVAHPTGTEEDPELQAAELIHIGEGEDRQINALHLTGPTVEQRCARPFHLMGRGQIDPWQRDLHRSTGLRDTAQSKGAAHQQQAGECHGKFLGPLRVTRS